MPRRFIVESSVGRLVPSLGGAKSPNRISAYFSTLSNHWFHLGQRSHVQLPAPQGGWARYALTLTADAIYVRCQGFSGKVIERIFHAPRLTTLDRILSTRVDRFFAAFNETYRNGLELGYGWPNNHPQLPRYLPNYQDKTLMEAYYMRYSNLTLLLGSHHLLLSGWSPTPPANLRGHSVPITVLNTDNPFVLEHDYRWRGITDIYVETPYLLKQAAATLSAPWPLTGTEG